MLIGQVPKLDKWARFNNVLVGRAFNHPEFENGQRVKTNHVAILDENLGMAKCSGNEIWQLGEPGKLSMYVDPVTKRFY